MKITVLVSLFNKVAEPESLQLYQKVPLTQVFFCKYCKIFKNIFFQRSFMVAASMCNVYEKFLVQKQPPVVFHRKAVIKSFTICTVKHLVLETSANLLKTDSDTRVFLCILQNF